ncbi:hypothetical protein [Oceanobacillus sp. FSL H7-0719]|uniref:hypothetical protein n=1 Tax=Oceanobacillus sp. FSL H7-0719 TaxID=2954507 RepID=UPI00324E61CF
MMGWLIGLVVAACIIALAITYRVLKVEEKKQKEYKKEGAGFGDELERSHEYEEKSLKSNLPNLSWIYIVAAVIIIIAFVIYLF